MSYQAYIAVDLGAESGRVMVGLWNGRGLALDAIHRFPNSPIQYDGTLRWDIDRLWREVEHGLTLAARRHGKSIRSLGVDSWALDYVLLSPRDERLGLPFCYRDARTRGGIEDLCRRIPREEVFAASGLQFMEINTLCQLLAHQRDAPETIASAGTFLMIPDYLHWLLSGVKACEFTNATSTQFVHPGHRGWSGAMLERLGLPTRILPPIIEPGSPLAAIRPEVASRLGLGPITIVAPATHDTASAVAAVPTEATGRSDWAYLSSGTWSLLGVEVESPVVSNAALRCNATNEGGVDGTYRLLKNIMGLWLLQQCRRSFAARGLDLDYAALTVLGSKTPPLVSLINPDDPRFLHPPDMPEAIAAFCRETRQPVPSSEGAFVRCVLESLALKYHCALTEIEALTGTPCQILHIVGGGSLNGFLNQLTADACGLPVSAGPVEATALGNLLMQVRSFGEIESLSALRAVVRASTEMKWFEPAPGGPWPEARARMRRLCALPVQP